ncbi:hypothetical protein F4803DRAFT_289812 [Xylaria telfairii]|nr:hypothetical protein F4803DRAFT_289812 [Xylaria telfairii]
MGFRVYNLRHTLSKALITTITTLSRRSLACSTSCVRLCACTKSYEEEYLVVQKAQETGQPASVLCICHDELVSSRLGAMWPFSYLFHLPPHPRQFSPIPKTTPACRIYVRGIIIHHYLVGNSAEPNAAIKYKITK